MPTTGEYLLSGSVPGCSIPFRTRWQDNCTVTICRLTETIHLYGHSFCWGDPRILVSCRNASKSDSRRSDMGVIAIWTAGLCVLIFGLIMMRRVRARREIEAKSIEPE